MKNSFDEKILEEANDWINTNQKVVLATVIQTWGSSPRQVGSRMIVNEKGDFSGSVSGGCVESAVVSECLSLIKDNKKIKYENIHMNDKVSKISIVGAGMVATPGVTYKMFRSLSEEKINLLAISTSEIKISVIIDEKSTINAVKKLHKTFNLD